jgi:hypothetical protein
MMLASFAAGFPADVEDAGVWVDVLHRYLGATGHRGNFVGYVERGGNSFIALRASRNPQPFQ